MNLIIQLIPNSRIEKGCQMEYNLFQCVNFFFV